MKKIINKCRENPYIVVLSVFVLSVAPMIFLGLYAFPQADDFCFSDRTHSAWITTHSVVEVIKQACLTSASYWYEWAGTFSSVFFFSLQPALFGSRGYVIVPFLFIGLLSFSIWLFANAVMIRIMKLNIKTSRFVAGFIMLYVIWYMPNACQAFYWYNSAAHYILSFSMMLITSSLVINACESKYNLLFCSIATLTGVMVGGGNFISALLMSILYFFFGAFFIYNKRKKMLPWIIPAIAFYISFIINVVAPGNGVRQEVMNVEPDNPVMAIINSFGYALHYCFSEWMNIFIILVLLILIPFIWRGVSKCDFSFGYPAIVIFLSFCLVASMYAPPAYAEHSPGPGRVQNIIFSFYIICLILDEVYLLGWLHKKKLNIDVKTSIGVYVSACITLVLFFGVVFYKYNDKYCNTLTALSIIKNGQAVEYATVVEENIRILNSDESEVTIHKIIDGPSFFYSREIDDWKSGTKAYFNKETIEYEE